MTCTVKAEKRSGEMVDRLEEVAKYRLIYLELAFNLVCDFPALPKIISDARTYRREMLQQEQYN